MTLTVGELCSGIGGFTLAAEALEWDTLWLSEIDPDCSFWLNHHFPYVPNLGDFTAFDWSTVERPDILCAGWPCQPHSVAGKRDGSDDKRDLWPFVFRCLRALRPAYFCGENVPGLLTSDGGRFFNRILSDLASIGYDVRWDVLSAAECGAPHRRERVWIVAYPAHDDGRAGVGGTEAGTRPDGERGRRHSSSSSVGDPASGGRGTGQGEPVRRALGGRDGVGDPDRERGCSGTAGVEDAADVGARNQRLRLARTLRNPWSDAIPYRGADGTVRLIPAGAVADAQGRNAGEPIARGGRRTEGRQDHGGGGGEVRQSESEEEVSRPEPALRFVVTRISRRLVGCDPSQENAKVEEEVNADASEGHATETLLDLRNDDGAETNEWPAGRCGRVQQATALLAFLRELAGDRDAIGSQSASETPAGRSVRSLRCDGEPARGSGDCAGCPSCGRESLEQLARELADAVSQVPHGVASRTRLAWAEGHWSDASELLAGRHAAEEEAEPLHTPHGLNNEQGQQGGEFTKQLYRYDDGQRGSLWPVTDSEPGRVARLKAVGNSVSPAWVLAGPFQFILDREASLPSSGAA